MSRLREASRYIHIHHRRDVYVRPIINRMSNTVGRGEGAFRVPPLNENLRSFSSYFYDRSRSVILVPLVYAATGIIEAVRHVYGTTLWYWIGI